MVAHRVPPAVRLRAGLKRTSNGCLEWTRSTFNGGYGRIWVDGKTVSTHRLAWELVNGPIPPGLNVLHHCDNPPCVQTDPTDGYPDGHLFLGTDTDNVVDMDTKGRRKPHTNGNEAKTHCPENHAYSGTNLYVTPSGTRQCRTCKRGRTPK